MIGIVTRIGIGMLTWIGHVERISESRLQSSIYYGTVHKDCPRYLLFRCTLIKSVARK